MPAQTTKSLPPRGSRGRRKDEGARGKRSRSSDRQATDRPGHRVAYDVNGSRILVPQRVEPERWRPEAAPATAAPRDTGYGVPGAEDFLAVIADAPQEQQVFLRRLAEWAIGLGKRSLVPQLSTYHRKAGITTLLLRLSDGAGLVTIYKDTRSAYLQLFRSVFERRAPRSLAAVEAAIGEPLRQGNVVYEVSDQLLAALTAAYEEAATGQLT